MEWHDRLRANALRLNFQAIWQQILEEEDGNGRPVDPASPQARAALRPLATSSQCHLASLPADVCTLMMEFCGVSEILRVSQLCSTGRHLVMTERHDATIWSRQVEAHFGWLSESQGVRESPVSVQRMHYSRYVHCLLLETRAELRHWLDSCYLVDTMCRMRKGRVIGLVSNIGRFKDPRVAIAVSAARYQAMRTVIIREKSDAMEFKKLLKFAGPVSFCSLSHDNLLWMQQVRLPPIDLPGFVGYATELIDLRPEEEYLRYTALLLSYGPLSVWRTLDEAREAERRLGHVHPSLMYVSLDMVSDREFATDGDPDEDSEGPLAPASPTTFDYEKWCGTGDIILEGVTGVQSTVSCRCHVPFRDFRNLPEDGDVMKVTNVLLTKESKLESVLKNIR